MEDVAVLGDVVLALGAHLAGVLGALLAAAGDEVGIGDGLGPDEAALEVSMDDAGRLWRRGAAPHRPGLRLLRSGREEGEEVEQLVAGADHLRQTGLLEAEALEERALLG